jgi:predicted dehydrogenase/threonine dehydrogenase-like Zn-dependent dehydrogenase
MRQILQSLKTGATEVANVPVPATRRGQLLIKSSQTLISAGTERMLVDFGKAGWLEKARQQPDKVRMVLDKMMTDGLLPTLEAVFSKLEQPLPLGYCNVGEVVELGPGVTGFAVGERVVSNGKHADVVSVPVNLCARVPPEVTDEQAAFAVLGAIALQGIRLVRPTLGETVVVTGLGLIGLMAVQLLRAHGCRVIGLDFDRPKLDLARQFGAETVDLSGDHNPVAAVQMYSRGRGADAVIISASTSSNTPVHQAAQMCRKRGRIVLVGVTGLELSRADFFEKELSFQVSCSYGPGRYDPAYEEKGHDYPVGFVRWTEQRNLEAVLDMMADARLDVRPLISHRFSIDEAILAYALVSGPEPSLGIILSYPGLSIDATSRTVSLGAKREPNPARAGGVGVSVIGSGSYATARLIPAFKAAGARLRLTVSSTGVSAVSCGRKFGFDEATTDPERALSDVDSGAVVIATRHDSHAALVLRALGAGKHVFVEKPLCLTMDELVMIEAASRNLTVQGGAAPLLMVGFNRRFSPQVQRIAQLMRGDRTPKAFVLTVNAGSIPPEHWTQDLEVGGGRLVGEACHFIDLLRFLAGHAITKWQVVGMKSSTRDTVALQLEFADGSIGTVHYFANGSKAFPKERLEVFSEGRTLQLDNFRKLTGFGWPGFKRLNLWRQDKGQEACARAFLEAIVHGKDSPIPLEQIVEVSRVSIEIAEYVH